MLLTRRATRLACCVAALLIGSADGQPSNASDALLSTAAYVERPHPSAHAAMELPGMTGTDFELLDLPAESMWQWASGVLASAREAFGAWPLEREGLELVDQLLATRTDAALHKVRLLRCLAAGCNDGLAALVVARMGLAHAWYRANSSELDVGSDAVRADAIAEKSLLVEALDQYHRTLERPARARALGGGAPRNGLLFSAEGLDYMRLALCNARDARATLDAARADEWGVAFAVAGAAGRRMHASICEAAPTLCTLDHVVEVDMPPEARERYVPRLLHIRALRYSPFARVTVFMDSDSRLVPSGVAALARAARIMERAGAAIALPAEGKHAAHLDRTRRDAPPRCAAEWERSSRRAGLHATRQNKEHTIVKWIPLILEQNCGTIMYRAREPDADLLFRRWEYLFRSRDALNPSRHERDQASFVVAYSEVLPAYLRLDPLLMPHPRACCAHRNVVAVRDVAAAGCVVCHDFTARTVPFAKRAAGHSTPYVERAGVRVCPEFANISTGRRSRRRRLGG